MNNTTVYMKRAFLHSLPALLVGILALAMTSCSSSDEGDDAGSKTISRKALVGQTYYKSEQTGGGENIETKKWTVTFKSENFASVQVYGSGYDDDGRYSWDYGQKDCTYSVNGNKVTIPYAGENDYRETIEMVFTETGPIGWSGSTVNVFATDGDSSSSNQAGGYDDHSYLIGYYAPDTFVDYMKQRAKAKEANGDTNWSSMEEEAMGFRIVDGSTIQQVYVHTSTTKPGSSSYLFLIGNYTVSRQFFTLYFYFENYVVQEYKYALNGSAIELSSSNMKLEYKGGKIYDGQNTYSKVAGYE